MNDLVEIPSNLLLKGLDEAIQQSQDMSILYRKNNYLAYALQALALNGAKEFFASLVQKGVIFYAPPSVAKEVGVNVDS